MSCAFDKERLTAFYDGEISPGGKAEVERHIAACSECLRDLGEIKAFAEFVKNLPHHRAPGSIAQGVSREIAPAGRGKVHRFLVWAAAAAAGLFVMVNVIYFSLPRTEAPAPVAQAAAETKVATVEPSAKVQEPPVPADPQPVLVAGEIGSGADLARLSNEAEKQDLEFEERDEPSADLAQAPAREDEALKDEGGAGDGLALGGERDALSEPAPEAPKEKNEEAEIFRCQADRLETARERTIKVVREIGGSVIVAEGDEAAASAPLTLEVTDSQLALLRGRLSEKGIWIEEKDSDDKGGSRVASSPSSSEPAARPTGGDAKYKGAPPVRRVTLQFVSRMKKG